MLGWGWDAGHGVPGSGEAGQRGGREWELCYSLGSGMAQGRSWGCSRSFSPGHPSSLCHMCPVFSPPSQILRTYNVLNMKNTTCQDLQIEVTVTGYVEYTSKPGAGVGGWGA